MVNKSLLLNLVVVYIIYIIDSRSNKYQMKEVFSVVLKIAIKCLPSLETRRSIGTGVPATYSLAVPSQHLSCKDRLKVFFYSMLPDFRKSVVFRKVPRFCPFVPVRTRCR